LTPEQHAKTVFSVDDPEWRKWMNQHFYIRQGTGFNEMTEVQREAAFDLLRASLSAKGLQQSRDIMRLNPTPPTTAPEGHVQAAHVRATPSCEPQRGLPSHAGARRHRRECWEAPRAFSGVVFPMGQH
jgi:hypothetical protein